MDKLESTLLKDVISQQLAQENVIEFLQWAYDRVHRLHSSYVEQSQRSQLESDDFRVDSDDQVDEYENNQNSQRSGSEEDRQEFVCLDDYDNFEEVHALE